MKRVFISERGLVRLLSNANHTPPVLRGLVDSDDELAALEELEGLTSARLRAERGEIAAIDRRELAFRRRANDLKTYGVTHINAALTNFRKTGNRFNPATRGAWYCSWDALTSVEEVGFHRTRELRYTNQFHDTAIYIELLADFIGEFPDLHSEPDHPALHPDPDVGYVAGQALAHSLRADGASGLIYPSVRHRGGRCFVAFESDIIQNVRPGAKWQFEWRGTPEFSCRLV